ncbi:peptidylprolyl isomerase [Sandarakinorhabdus sp. DWP1-3-1]|uniref:peptidylprolyl isomerase n=1 Tax=Sandarakinorhabdus sp. DWP1-3-1 TaxID=2804627 RepID=UPI003CE7E1F0
MITFIRRWLTSWPVLVLLALVLVAFAVTGVGDPFGGGSAPQGSVARVGKTTITEADLLKAFDRVVKNARAQNPAVNQMQLAREGAVPAVAEQLIGQTAIEELGRSMGLIASDRAVGGVIGAIPAFQQGGKFDDPTYRRLLQENNLTDNELRETVAGDIVRRQLLTPVMAALGVPAGMAQPYARLLVDVHVGAAALVPLAAVAPATDAEVAAYYASNKARFTLPERRAFRYAVIDRAALATGVTVSDADIAAAFAKEPAKYGAAATRKLQQVVVPDEAKARAIAAAAVTEGFPAAAQRLAGFGVGDITLGEQSQAEFGKATSPAVAAAAFALPVGGLTQPLKTAFGWHIVRVEAMGSAGKTLAQARPAIEADLRQRAAETAVATLVNGIEDGVEAGKSFADLARDKGLTIVSQAAVTREGTTPGAAVPPTPELATLAARAFRHEPGDGAAVEDLGEQRLVVIETMQVLPSAPQPLGEVRAAAAAAAAQEKALKAARARADAVVVQTRKTGDFAAAVAAAGLAPPQSLRGRRIDIAGQQQVPPIIQAFLSTPAKTVQVLPGSQGWVLIHVDSITPGDVTAVPQLLDASRRELASQLPAEFSSAFAAAAAKAMGTSRNDTTITAVTRRLSGFDSAQ